MYNPKKYWENRGKDYKGIEPVNELNIMFDTLKEYFKSNVKILEVGSGYGRIYGYISKYYDNITLCDFVDSMRNKCKKKVGILPDKWDGIKLPYFSNQFDLLILYDVLMHVEKDNIINFLKEMSRVSKHIYIATYLNNSGDHKVDHVIEHNYDKIFNKCNLDSFFNRIIKRDGEKYDSYRLHSLLKRI